ncbi:unnamed protein product [Ectocarpus sp. 13 AM-2016]
MEQFMPRRDTSDEAVEGVDFPVKSHEKTFRYIAAAAYELMMCFASAHLSEDGWTSNFSLMGDVSLRVKCTRTIFLFDMSHRLA